MRDMQSRRLWLAERYAMDPFTSLLGPGGTTLMIDRALRSKAIPWRPSDMTMIWGPTRRGTWGDYESATITLYPQRGTGKIEDWVVVHELAHLAIDRLDIPDPGHGRDFARIYLALVEELICHEAAKVLRREFRARKVRWLRKRDLSDEQRAHLADVARARFGRTA
jgi:hypothetical protein